MLGWKGNKGTDKNSKFVDKNKKQHYIPYLREKACLVSNKNDLRERTPQSQPLPARRPPQDSSKGQQRSLPFQMSQCRGRKQEMFEERKRGGRNVYEIRGFKILTLKCILRRFKTAILFKNPSIINGKYGGSKTAVI